MTFTIQADWPVLVLEDAPERIAWFKERVPQAVYCATADEAIQALSSQEFRVVFLDHDLHWMHAANNTIVKGTGKEVALHLSKAEFPGVVVASSSRSRSLALYPSTDHRSNHSPDLELNCSRTEGCRDRSQSGKGVFTVLEVYVDESYKNGRVMCVGGWLCEKETWKDIESKWAARIQYERRMSERKGFPPISRYHATDCASLRREFDRSKGWDEDRQIRFVKKLIDIIGQIRPIGIAVGCSLDDTRKVFGTHQEAETWAYRICMMWCMDLIGELIDEHWSGEKVDFFHEQSDRFNSAAQSAFKAMTANDSPHRKYFSSMTAVRWQDS